MSGEQVAAALTMGVLGVALLGVGVSARRGRLQLALGGWTRVSASPVSWAAAHTAIGSSFAAAGGVALLSAGAIVVSPGSWAGPLAVGGSVVLLVVVVVVVVVGVARGTNRLVTAPAVNPTCGRGRSARQSNRCSLPRSSGSGRCSGRSTPSTTRRSVN